MLECDNYRPISFLSSISKILEKIVAHKRVNLLLSNDLLYAHQYGFLPKRSAEHNLMQISANYELCFPGSRWRKLLYSGIFGFKKGVQCVQSWKSSEKTI